MGQSLEALEVPGEMQPLNLSTGRDGDDQRRWLSRPSVRSTQTSALQIHFSSK